MSQDKKELFQSVDEYEKAIKSLEISIDLLKNSLSEKKEHIELHKALRDSCIQRFEFCVELGWKVGIRVLGLDSKAPNPAIREMARNKLIDSTDIWFDFLTARNKTSHTYAEDVAKEVYDMAVKSVPHFHVLLRNLKGHLK